MNNLEATIEQAQKITIGQVDNGTLATAVNCADTLQIVRHGRVESYVIPKHLIDDLLLKMAVIECDNKRLLGERVAESIPVPNARFYHDLMTDMDALKTDDLPKAIFEAQYQQVFKSQRERESIELKAKRVEDFKTWVRETTGDYEYTENKQTPRCRHCLDPNCQLDDLACFDRYWLTQPMIMSKQPVVIKTMTGRNVDL